MLLQCKSPECFLTLCPNILLAAIPKCQKGAQAIMHHRCLDAGRLAGPGARGVADHDSMYVHRVTLTHAVEQT